ncbi:MAG: glycosyltransferase [Cellulomonas sp.]|jgi:hypothetical protein|nr:glycosyltransferase [Cellulomonas sp.]
MNLAAATVWSWLPLLLTPLLFLTDWVGHVRSFAARRGPDPERAKVVVVDGHLPPTDDYTIVVPIYGDMKYLESVEWLAQDAARVVLATSGSETPRFYSELKQVAETYGFSVFIGSAVPRATSGARSTGGAVANTILREVHAMLTTEYVIRIDADTVTERPIRELVAAFAQSGCDIGSVVLAVANGRGLLPRLQRIEYTLAMRMRRVMPWMVSGGCHIVRRVVHRDMMADHSLFFQGEDVELGLRAQMHGYQAKNFIFRVPTVVPDTPRAWWRQRIAWAGGEFRIMVVNIRFAWRHPFLWFYAIVVVQALAPVRWFTLPQAGWAIGVIYAAYVLAAALVVLPLRDPVVVLYPLYAFVFSMMLLPFGWLSYLIQARRFRNVGIIRGKTHPRHPSPQVLLARQKGASWTRRQARTPHRSRRPRGRRTGARSGHLPPVR